MSGSRYMRCPTRTCRFLLLHVVTQSSLPVNLSMFSEFESRQDNIGTAVIATEFRVSLGR